MVEMIRTEIGRLRLAGLIEGASFIVLLFVAMPLKYLAGKPAAVSVVGMAHGVLFLAFCLALLAAWVETKWPFRRAALVFFCAFIPFGPFLIDTSLRREEERRQAGRGALE